MKIGEKGMKIGFVSTTPASVKRGQERRMAPRLGTPARSQLAAAQKPARGPKRKRPQSPGDRCHPTDSGMHRGRYYRLYYRHYNPRISPAPRAPPSRRALCLPQRSTAALRPGLFRGGWRRI